MKFLLILLTILSPLQKQTIMQISLDNPCEEQKVFIKDYHNQNFSQSIEFTDDQMRVVIKNIDFLQLNLNFAIKRDNSFINQQTEEVQETIRLLLKGCLFTGDYLKKISTFLRDNIQYSESNSDQSPASILISRKADCVGYSKLSKILFRAVRIKCQIVQGFFLDTTVKKNFLSPRSHLWIEIFLKDNFSIFYDPQYQNFSPNYIRVDNQVNFTEIKKFKVKVIDKQIKVKN
jgi:hypothetical protein